VNAARVRPVWLIRGALALGVLALLVAALGTRTAAQTPLPTATPRALAAAVPTVDVATPRPTFTSQPYVERIVSRVARVTQVPYPTSTPKPDAEIVVSAVDFGYMPSQVQVHAGQTVAWTNDGNESHDVTSDDDDWHSGQLFPTVSYRHVFGFAGTFTYHCSIHLDMRGSITVLP